MKKIGKKPDSIYFGFLASPEKKELKEQADSFLQDKRFSAEDKIFVAGCLLSFVSYVFQNREMKGKKTAVLQ